MKKLKKQSHKLVSMFLAFLMMFGCFSAWPTQVNAAELDYEIYPKPHLMDYQSGNYIIHQNVNIVYEDGIDDDTKARMKEVLAIKNINATVSDKAVEGQTNILVGIKGSNGYVDKQVSENYTLKTNGLYDKLDSYLLTSDNGTITVLGKDTDAAFYGITSLYHIFNQMDSYSIRNFVMEDYADVASRGFIEGYYGNPWSVKDRSDLMKFGGYYKMNAYFYAPKDDPKHRAQWDSLYTDEELDALIKPLAKAGNESKCRYIYALHPFPNGNHFSFDNDEAYAADLAKLQAKFKQVIDCGVRQIAILADDFWNPGGDNGLRLLKDMTAWLEEIQVEYPDMKLTIPYVPFDYMGNGGSGELQILKNAPENIQIVMTGGRVWGEVSTNFTNTFTNNVGRGPFMWINWPCTDNSKEHLIMGGNDTFLHPGVDPETIQGIMLNPMQQSEPSKVAIFANADYAWNVWEEKSEADQCWEDSFKYVDHNSAAETPASTAFREISRHMINQNMDSRVTVLQESLNIRDELTAFKNKLSSGTVTADDCDSLLNIFTSLKEYANTYKNNPGNSKTRDQIIYWLDCWEDTTNAAINYLNAYKSYLVTDSAGLISNYNDGKSAFNDSKTHTFWYVDHNEKAEVGVQHIVPFINALGTELSKKVEEVVNPTAITKTYISNRFTTPASGTVDNLFDENDATTVQFTNPNFILKDDYIGVKFNRGVDVNSIRIAMGGGKNHFYNSKLEYTLDGETWQEVSDEIYTVPKGSEEPIEVNNLGLKNILGIRLIVTQDNGDDSWLLIKGIDINKSNEPAEEPIEKYVGTVSSEGIASQRGAITNLTDGNNATETMFAKSPYENPDRDTCPAGSTVTMTFDNAKNVNSFYIFQGHSNAGDIVGGEGRKAILEYLNDSNEWVKVADLALVQEQTLEFDTVTTTALRIKLVDSAPIWWRLGEIYASYKEDKLPPVEKTISISDDLMIGKNSSINDGAKNNKIDYIIDGDMATLAWLAKSDNGNIPENATITVNFSREMTLGKMVFTQDSGDKVNKVKFEYLDTEGNWQALSKVDDLGATYIKDYTNDKIVANAVRIVVTEGTAKWWKVFEWSIDEVAASDSTENVYTNIENASVKSEIAEGTAKLLPASVTLGKDEYVGLKLDYIKEISNIIAQPALPDGFVLESSINGLEWNIINLSSRAAYTDARYIRIRNTNDGPEKFDLINLQVDSVEVLKKSLVDCSIKINSDYANGDMRNAGNFSNLFDNNLSTVAAFNGYPQTGDTAVIDLGQSVDFNAFRYYIVETNKNYIRDAVFEVADSPDADQWTEILVVGDGTEVNVWDDTNAKDASYLIHDSKNPGYMFAANDDLNVSGRYLRIRFTTTYDHRFVSFSELMINNGEYLPQNNMKDFITSCIEEPYKIPANMIDGDLSTTYKPSQKNGTMTYRLSNPDGLRSIRFVQEGKTSNASVSAEVYVNNDYSKTETIELGTLNQTISEFNIPTNMTLKTVSIAWSEDLPEISEIMTFTTSGTVNKDALIEKVNELKDTDTSKWTVATAQKFADALAIARSVMTNDYLSQDSVDSALGALVAAYNNQVERYDITELQKLVDEEISNANGIYSLSTYSQYSYALDAAKTALANKDNLNVEKGTSIYNDLVVAKGALEFSVGNRELAQVAIEKASRILSDNYTTDSFKVVADAKVALETLVNKDINESRVHPEDMAKVTAVLNNALDALVDVSELNALISEFNTLDKDLYISETYNLYKVAVEESKPLLVNGTTDNIKAAIENISSKKESLIFVSTIDLNKAIEVAESVDAKLYSKATLDKLNKIISEAKANTGISDDKNKDYITKIHDAIKALVNIQAIDAKLAEVGQLDLTKYTQPSLDKLNEAIELVKGVKETAQAVSDVTEAIETLNKAISGLKLVADEMDEYRQEIKFDTAKELYTSDSYKEYKDAYEKLMNLADDASYEAFIKAKVAYETALSNLTYNNADYSKVEAAKKNIPSDLSIYTAESVAKLNEVLNSIEYNLNILEQEKVDQYAKAIEDAIKGLVIKTIVVPVPDANTPDKSTGTKTGDTAMIGTFVALGMLSVAGLWLYRKKDNC